MTVEELREQRLAAARTQKNWTELAPDRLAPTGPASRGWLKDESGDVYTPSRGAVFLPGTARVFATVVPVTFTVDDGEVVPLDRIHQPTTSRSGGTK